MNLNSLFEKQKELDEYIAKEKGLDKKHTFGYQLGFTEQDVIKAYDEKNEINYERQNSNY